MNSSGKQLVAFWLHRRGEHWSVKSVDKGNSTSEVMNNLFFFHISSLNYNEMTFLIFS